MEQKAEIEYLDFEENKEYEELINKVLEECFLVEEMQIEEDKITPESELVNDLGFNSLELAELVIHCEEIYDVEFDEEVAKNLVTVDDVVKYLTELVA